ISRHPIDLVTSYVGTITKNLIAIYPSPAYNPDIIIQRREAKRDLPQLFHPLAMPMTIIDIYKDNKLYIPVSFASSLNLRIQPNR
ncbi:MAG: hypothetical protein ACFFCW_26355, partial [Candidatus Hodarchaeota archaeon]